MRLNPLTMKNAIKTKANARKVLKYVDCGLVAGMGDPSDEKAA